VSVTIQIGNTKIEESAWVASITKQSFFSFVEEFWDYAVPEDPVWNWHIEYLCDELQILAERVFANKPKLYDLIINVPPGSTKSTICSVMFPAWVWTRMPSARIIGGSYAADLSRDLALKNRDVVLSEKYQACFGKRYDENKHRYVTHVKIRQDQQAKSNFMTTAGGARWSVGVGGAITGRHGHFIVVDDPLDPKEGRSEVKLLAANRWMAETLATRKVDKEVVPTILIMQRLHQNDCTADMLERSIEGTPVKHICLPAEESKHVKPEELHEKYVDGLLDPIRLSRKILKDNRANGPYQYAGQFMQYPVPEGGGMFMWEKINIQLPPREIEFVMRVRYWDKAATHDDGCYTVGALLGKDKQGRYWILHIIRGQWGTGEREQVIKQTADTDGKKVYIYVEQEPGSGGKDSAFATIKMLAGFKARADRPTGDKVVRAEPFAAQVDIGNVYMAPAPWNRAYLDEMEYFPDSKYKDQIDASSGAFNIVAKGRRIVGGWMG